jgi:hypothetical protein
MSSLFSDLMQASGIGAYVYRKFHGLRGKSDPIYGTHYGCPLFESTGLYPRKKRRSSMLVRAPLPISAKMVLRCVLLFRNGRRVDPLY